MSNNKRLKYTADYCRKNDIVVVCNTFEEYQEIKKIDNWSGTSLDREVVERNLPSYFFENSVDMGWGSCSSRCFKDHKGSCTAEEFIKDNEMIPEKWRIKITKENYTFLDRYLHSNSHKYTEYKKETWTTKISGNDYKTWWFYSEEVDISKGHSMMDILPEFTEITFDQLLKITNQTNLTEFPKELIQLLEQIK